MCMKKYNIGFQASTGGLETFSLQIRGDYCISRIKRYGPFKNYNFSKKIIISHL